MKPNYKFEGTEFYIRDIDTTFPVAASFHGDSTIIIDAQGNWITGQIDRNQVNKLVNHLNMVRKDGNPFEPIQTEVFRICEHQSTRYDQGDIRFNLCGANVS